MSKTSEILTAAAHPDIPWLKPPLDDGIGDVWQSGIRLIGSGPTGVRVNKAFDLELYERNIQGDGDQPEGRMVIAPNGMNSARRVVAQTSFERSFDFNDPQRIARTFKGVAQYLAQFRQWQTVLQVDAAAAELRLRMRDLLLGGVGLDSPDENFLEEAAIVEPLLVSAKQTTMRGHLAGTAMGLADMGIEWVEDTGERLILSPAHTAKLLMEGAK